MNRDSMLLGVCYYPEHWPQEVWATDAERMAACGISHVRIAEFCWSRIEPQRGQFDFSWLDAAIETLGTQGLKVIMCTPTATPPKWLVDEMPDMVAVDKLGRPRRWGSRRHYDFSHQGYRDEAARITKVVAERYGQNPHVVAWQTDNEYGCHDTTLSYSEAARLGFHDWLAQKYQSVEALNKAWGAVFWSMEVSQFSEVELPHLTVTEPNPSHVLDFRRYASDQVVAFNRLQTKILRHYAPGRDLVHNFMGHYLEFDHFDVSQDLDVASWDSYPLGMLEQFCGDNAWKNWYMRAGDPDFQAFHHDLYRGCGQGRMWVMEQQPGPVNWAPWNPDPHVGMVRLWSHEAYAHGAELVSYFRWRQAPFAQEQLHSALNRPDGSADRGYHEAKQVSDEIAQLPPSVTGQADVALVFDYPSQWASETQPQGADYDGFTLALQFYRGLRKLGQSVDIVPTSASFENYKMVVLPHVLMVDEELIERLEASNARVLFGPRSGSRSHSHHIPDLLAPGPIQKLLPMRVERVESLRPNHYIVVEEGGCFHRWAEHVEAGEGTNIQLSTVQGRPAWLAKGKVSYIAGWPDEELCAMILQQELEAANLRLWHTGEDLRLRDRGNLRVIVNYGPKPQDAEHLIGKDDKILIGSELLDVAGVTIVKKA